MIRVRIHLHKIVGFEESICKSINTSCITANEHEWLDAERKMRYMDSLPFGDKKIGQNAFLKLET